MKGRRPGARRFGRPFGRRFAVWRSLHTRFPRWSGSGSVMLPLTSRRSSAVPSTTVNVSSSNRPDASRAASHFRAAKNSRPRAAAPSAKASEFTRRDFGWPSQRHTPSVCGSALNNPGAQRVCERSDWLGGRVARSASPGGVLAPLKPKDPRRSRRYDARRPYVCNDFVCRNSSNPNLPSSRPCPDCLYPPKGAIGLN